MPEHDYTLDPEPFLDDIEAIDPELILDELGWSSSITGCVDEALST